MRVSDSHTTHFSQHGKHLVVAGGLGRVFVSRAVLDAPTLDAAIAVAVRAGQAGGHNYQLAQRSPRGGRARIVNVEAASGGRHAVTEVGGERPGAPGALFHANSYLHLKIAQTISNSTAHRLARAAALPTPTSPAQVEAVLGDQADAPYPVFHDDASEERGDLTGDWTLQSLGVDMVNCKVSVFDGNPGHGKVAQSWPIPACQVH